MSEPSKSPDKSEAQEHDQPPKQRRRRMGVDPSLILSEGRSKRRKTPTPPPAGEDEAEAKGENDPKDPARAKLLGGQIMKQIMEQKDKDGHSLSYHFTKLPNKRAFPDYFEIIKHPMSLEMVQAKLDASAYETLRDVCNDLSQIFNNAKRYNVKESLLFQYAKKLHKLTRMFYVQATSPQEENESESEEEGGTDAAVARGESLENAAAGPSSTSADGEPQPTVKRRRGPNKTEGPTVYRLIKPILKAIQNTASKDGSGRLVSAYFLALPDRRTLPDYYKLIESPISLQEIEAKQLGRRYDSPQEFYDDIELMAKNAMFFNEDSSDVYKDAEQVKTLLEHHKLLVAERLQRPPIQRFRLKGSSATPVHMGAPSTGYAPASTPATASYAPPPPMTPSPYPYAQASKPVHSTPASVPYLPALPQGVVTEEVVASLSRYPEYERQAWIQSLPTLALQVYRQLMVKLSAPPQSAPSAPAPPIIDSPVFHKPSLPQIPTQPTISHMIFTYSSTAKPDDSLRQSIKLRNMRGVITHAIVIGPMTSELELTAYLENETDEAAADPEVSLRINGNVGGLPRFVYRTFGHGSEERRKPIGMKWIVLVPLGRYEMKLEIVVSRPGAMGEVSSIFVGRQY
ncbi:hypothetical protein P7C73_g2928, partial [Tremellales sp. Uapishka_1]